MHDKTPFSTNIEDESSIFVPEYYSQEFNALRGTISTTCIIITNQGISNISEINYVETKIPKNEPISNK